MFRMKMFRITSPVLAATVLIVLCRSSTSTPIWGLQGGIGRNIRHLPCVSRKTGEAGTCMFAFSCAKANGTHLGTCIDRFYFGSCCKVPEGSDFGLGLIEDNHLGEGDVTPTTQRIRPAITQKLPPVTTTSRPTSTRPTSSSPRPSSVRPSSVKPSNTRPSSARPTTRPTTTRPPPSSIKPSTGSARPSKPSSTTIRPILSTEGPTTAPPTLVTWTTFEGPSSAAPQKPAPSTFPPVTHRPTLVTASGTLRPPSKKPTPGTTKRPTSPPNNKPHPPTNKPGNKPKPDKPAPSTPRPSQTQEKPTSTTWVPVSVSTHAPSTTKKPLPTKKPSIGKPTPGTSSTTTQGVVNILEVSSTWRPETNSPSRPSTVTSSHPPTKPSTGKPVPTFSTTKPFGGISSTAKPPSVSSTNRPSISITTKPSPSSTPSSPSRPTLVTGFPSSTHRPPALTSSISTTQKPTTVFNLGSSSALPSVSTTADVISTTSETNVTQESTVSSTTPISTLNEIDSYNMTNYKDVCGRRLFPEARIVGGQLSSFGKWPWQISLRQWRTSTYLHKCGAALLNENWAITAAHCVENVPPSDLLLRLGEHDLSTEEEPYGFQERRVQIVASHPQFDPRTFEYDLALLRFYEPVIFQPNIIPICVPEDDTNFVGSKAFVTGWGRLYEDGPLPSVLQEVSVPVINNTLCETMYRAAGYIEHIPEIFICAGWKKGGFDSCEGDSGGPMVIQRPDKRWLLAGVISWGIGCAEPNQPGVYTRISQFRHWINQILQF